MTSTETTACCHSLCECKKINIMTMNDIFFFFSLTPSLIKVIFLVTWHSKQVQKTCFVEIAHCRLRENCVRMLWYFGTIIVIGNADFIDSYLYVLVLSSFYSIIKNTPKFLYPIKSTRYMWEFSPCGQTETIPWILKSQTKNFLRPLDSAASVLSIDLREFLLFLAFLLCLCPEEKAANTVVTNALYSVLSLLMTRWRAAIASTNVNR